MFDRQFGDCCNAVKALLTRNMHVLIAKLFENFGRELALAALYFLKAEHVRLVLFKKCRNAWGAQADGIDIPGDNRQIAHEFVLATSPMRKQDGR